MRRPVAAVSVATTALLMMGPWAAIADERPRSVTVGATTDTVATDPVDVTVSQFGVVVPDAAIAAVDPSSATPNPATDDQLTRVGDVLEESPDAGTVVPQIVVENGDDVVLGMVDAAARAASPVIEPADPFVTVGFTWPTGQLASPQLQVRVRYTDGRWGDWFALEPSDQEPDPTEVPEGRTLRSSTDAVWVGSADAVQIASVGDVTSAVPLDDVRLVTVAVASDGADIAAASDVGAPGVAQASFGAASSTVASAITTSTTLAPLATAAAAGGPAVVTRAQWGARPADCSWNSAVRLQAAVVHHTASRTGYTSQAEAINQLRADQAYHMDGRGWCDIGYNFVVDKFGNIYEGAAGSMDRAVIGAHAAPFNTGTVGISVIGCYGNCASGNAALPDAAVNAVGRIAGWRLGQYGVNPSSTINFDNGQQARTMPAIIGHRDVNSTACPGDNAYARLGDIRAAAQANKAGPGVLYRSHAAELGWLNFQPSGQMSGTTGQSRRLEATTVTLVNVPAGSAIECQAQVSKSGWLPWVGPTRVCGTTGKFLQLEAFRLRLSGPITSTHRLWYRIHVAERGWMGWASEGAVAGTSGFGLRAEALEITLLPKSAAAPGTTASPSSSRTVSYRAHAAVLGWMPEVASGIAGTTNQSRRIEAVNVRLPEAPPWPGGLECQAQVAHLGWMSWVPGGSTCGTTGRMYQMEGMRLRLTGTLATKADVWYRVHSATYGWSGWAKNGDPAGTQGLSLRAEAIEVRYQLKGAAAPGPTANAFRKP